MSLKELLAERGIKKALIVDDAFDDVPMAVDIDPGSEDWPNFNDDLTPEGRAAIAAAYPPAADLPFDALIADDGYVATVWAMRDELGKPAQDVFAQYLKDQASDQFHVELAREKLTALGLECVISGRDFEAEIGDVDLVLIDLFLNKRQDDLALADSKQRLRQALKKRLPTPPLVLLMSRSPRLPLKREEFRDEVGLIDSGFRIVAKSELEDGDRLELQLERLAENAADTRNLARFFAELENGMAAATARTLTLMRKLRLSDIGQIQQLLLSAEGEPVGSYLVDVFDRVLQHEIEREGGIISAAQELNGFSEARHPPPYVAGSPDLQELVERLLTQNARRLDLPGAIDAVVTFGDVLTVTANADLERLEKSLLVAMEPDKALLVLTPVCDLQRGGAPRILFLVGTIKALSAKDWSYRDDARTGAIRLGDELVWVKWDLKHVDTASHEQLKKAFVDGDLMVGARLREAHALELQQKLLSGLGRVGLVANMPASFPVDVEAYYAGTDGRPKRLDVPALNEGAVCYVGRDENSEQMIRLVFTEDECDGLIDRLAAVEVEQVAETARTAFGHVNSTPDLRRMLIAGISLKGVSDSAWKQIDSETGKDKNIPKMGLLAWNYAFPNEPLAKGDLNKAGIILLVRDVEAKGVPGLGDAIRSGLLQAEVDAEDEAAEPAATPVEGVAVAAAPDVAP